MSAAMTAVEQDGRIVLEAARSWPGWTASPAYAVAGSPGLHRADRQPGRVRAGRRTGALRDQPGRQRRPRDPALGHRRRRADRGGGRRPRDGGLAGRADGRRRHPRRRGGAADRRHRSVDDEARNWATAAAFAVGPAAGAAGGAGRAPSSTSTCPTRRATGSGGCAGRELARFGQVQMTIAEVGQGYVRTALEEHDRPTTTRAPIWLPGRRLRHGDGAARHRAASDPDLLPESPRP